MAGLGYVFVGFGRDYNVDPRLIVAIAGAETSYGKIITWGSNNAWNWGWNATNQTNSPFISFAVGIGVVTGGIRSSYLDRGRTTTSSIYVGTYCVDRPGHEGECQNIGLQNFNSILIGMGGNPSSLTFPCKD
jgi:hypothetical protein